MTKIVFVLLFWFAIVLPASAELVATWTFDGTTGLEKTAGTDSSGFWTGLTDGTKSVADSTGTYVTRVYDADRQSYVWQFTPASTNKGGFIKLGMIPTLGTTSGSTDMASDFTISCWVKSGTQSNGTSVILGERNNNAPGYTNTYNFFKVTPSGVEYVSSNETKDIKRVSQGITSPSDVWQYFTITKEGETLKTYINGVAKGSVSVAGVTLESLELKLGGENATSELWVGAMDQVTVHNNALTDAQVKEAYSYNLGQTTATLRESQATASHGKVSTLSNFNTTAQKLTKGSTYTEGGITWNVKEYGLENRGGGYTSNIEAQIVDGSGYGISNGLLRISGSFGESTSVHWSGTALQSSTTYEATPDNPLIFSVDRVSMSNTNLAARSSIWLWKDNSHYLHFGQNTENSNRWSFNLNNTAWGNSFLCADDLGNHNMTLKYDGTNIWMYADGKLVGKTATTSLGKDVYLMINGQSWGSNATAQGTVDVLFDTPQVIHPVAAQTEVPITCQFSDGSTTGWNVTGTGKIYTQMTETNHNQGNQQTLVNTGKLSVENTAEAQWSQGYLLDGLKVAVVRDSMDFSSAGTSGGLKLASLDGQKYITVSQNANGQWSLGWEGMEVTGLKNGGMALALNGNSADLYLGDFFQTQILMSAEGTESGTDFTLKLDAKEYTFSTDWNANGVLASLYANGTNAYVGFDDFAISGYEIPEPAAWVLALMGIGAFYFFTSKRATKIVPVKH